MEAIKNTLSSIVGYGAAENPEETKVEEVPKGCIMKNGKLVKKGLIPHLPKATKTCKLTMPDGEVYDLPILQGSEGAPMIDIRTLNAKTGHFTFDPGFTCTGSCASAITFIDGKKGILRYRGYDIEDIADNCTFIETCYLLLHGELPSEENLEAFEGKVFDKMKIEPEVHDLYKGFKEDAHPMAMMVSVTAALSAYNYKDRDYNLTAERENAAITLIAQFPVIATLAYRVKKGLPPVEPKKEFSYAHNFLHMMFHDPEKPDEQIPEYQVRAMDKIMILHADHEQNASASTVRLTGSSFANPFACISAGVASLWGPSHGGANEACLEMLDEIGDVEVVEEYVDKVKRKVKGIRLMGFGHRVYKNQDPRSRVMREIAEEVLRETGAQDDKLFKIATKLKETALEDDYFIRRNLYPNVDFFSGIVLQALKIPREFFTVLFALSRCIGWTCQWSEMISDHPIKIGRPRQLYVGEERRDFISMKERIRQEDEEQDAKDSGMFYNIDYMDDEDLFGDL